MTNIIQRPQIYIPVNINFKEKSRCIFFTLLFCVISFPLSLLLMLMLPLEAKQIFMLPFINGFLHGSLSHLIYNMIAFSLLIIPKINDYDFKSICLISFLISGIYLLFWFFGFPSAIGLSGIVYFLLARFLLSRKRFRLLSIILFLVLLFHEGTAINDLDGIGHAVHLIGLTLGFISLKYGWLMPTLN